jgi:hypothetical protein
MGDSLSGRDKLHSSAESASPLWGPPSLLSSGYQKLWQGSKFAVKNAWGYTSILPYILIAWRLIKYTETLCSYRTSSPDSSVGTVISLRAGRLGNLLSVFGKGKRFISLLDRLCGPTSVFYKNDQVLFLRGRSGGEVTANVDRHWMLRLNMSRPLPAAWRGAS